MAKGTLVSPPEIRAISGGLRFVPKSISTGMHELYLFCYIKMLLYKTKYIRIFTNW